MASLNRTHYDFVTPFGDVLNVAKKQGVVVDRRIERLKEEDFGLDFCYAPNLVLKGIAFAGQILRKDPDTALVDKPIELTKKVPRGSLGHLFLDILNGSIEPVNDVSRVSFVCAGALSAEACAYAETGFANAIKGLRNYVQDRDTPSGFLRSIVYVDENNSPTILQKYDGAKTGLTLAPIVINGIPYPPGSIARVETTADYYRDAAESSAHISWQDRIGPEVAPTVAISKIGFKRVSAYGLPVGERGVFENCNGSDAMSSYATEFQMPMDDIHALAQQFVDAAGPTNID